MFEQEMEMEERRGSFVPLLLIICLIVSFVTVATYFVLQSRRVLTTQETSPIITAALESEGPAMVHFHTGIIKASVEEKPHDPHYRLLEKMGFLKIGKDVGYKTPVSLTPKGEAFLKQLAGVKEEKDKDGTEAYSVPLARRRLVEISKITMVNPNRALVNYSWKWDTTAAGELFDAAGATVKGFNTWDRSTLISKYGAAFYHGEPTKVTLALTKGDNGWQVASE